MASVQSIGSAVVAASLYRGAEAMAGDAVATMDCLFKANGESGETTPNELQNDDTLMK